MDAALYNAMNLNLKQPEPSVGQDTNVQEAKNEASTAKVKKKREYNRPQVGVVDAPKISSTPLQDTLTIQKKEHPYMPYQPDSKGIKKFSLQGSLSALVLGGGTISLMSLLRAIKKKK